MTGHFEDVPRAASVGELGDASTGGAVDPGRAADGHVRLADDVQLFAAAGKAKLSLSPEHLEALVGLLSGEATGGGREMRELFSRGILDIGLPPQPRREEVAALLPTDAEQIYLSSRVALRLAFHSGNEPAPLNCTPLLGLFLEPMLAMELAAMERKMKIAAAAMLSAALARGRSFDPYAVTRVWGGICREHCERDEMKDCLKVEEAAGTSFRLVPTRSTLQTASCAYPSVRFEAALRGPGTNRVRQVTFASRNVPALGVVMRRLAHGVARDDLIDLVLESTNPDALRRALSAISKIGGFSAQPPPLLDWEGMLPKEAHLSLAHLGHATLLARGGSAHVCIDPWFPADSSALASRPVAPAQLPRLAAILLTHEHWDHVSEQSVLQYPQGVPVVVPRQDPDAVLAPKYREFLELFGIDRIVELDHWQTLDLGDGLTVMAVPFLGEGTAEEGFRRNCYLLRRAGANCLIHVDSSPDSQGRSDLTEGVIDRLVSTCGPIDVVYATRRQELHFAYSCGHSLMPVLMGEDPSGLLGMTENCCCSASYLAELAATTKCRALVLYSEGGGDWYPEGSNFLRGTPDDTLLPAFEYLWDPLEAIVRAVAAPVHLSTPLDTVVIGAGAVRFRPHAGR